MNSTIGLIDKNVIIRLGIGTIITENFDSRILNAVDLPAFKSTYAEKAPDMIILGNYGAPQECFDTVRQLRELFHNIPLVVYDENEKSDLTLMYLKLGVDAYIKKSSLSDEILPCLCEVMLGKRYLSPDLVQNLLSSLQGRTKRARTTPSLTERETQIAGLLCKGMRTNNIANTLERKPSTISTIKNTIFKKMNVKNILELSQALDY
jgi:DNA-binding NarL/FixJ family response regulator